MRRVVAIVLGVLALVATGTYVAGERNEVAVLRTWDAEGRAHETKLWVVDVDGRPWVRVASPGRDWFERLEERPEVELERAGTPTQYRAVPVHDPAMRERVDAAFSEKYGAIDWWYGVLLRRDPVPVRLDPRAAGPRDATGG